MKRLINLHITAVLAFIMATPAVIQAAEAPINFPGDTKSTIARRAQWIEEAKKEKNLSWWGILTPEEGKNVIAEFNKVYPFITVEYWRGSPEELATKVEAEFVSGRSQFDIILGAEPHNHPHWRKMGLLAKIAPIFPDAGKIDKNMYSTFGDWFIPGNNAITPQYNTNLVSADRAPKTWEDLLNPRWKGQIAVAPMVHAWYTLALADGGWGIEKTVDFLTKLKNQGLIYSRGHSAAHALMITGDFGVTAAGFVYHVLKSKEKGAPVEWSRVNPVPVTGPALILNTKAPHANAARLFLEWVSSPQGLIAYDRITYYGAIFPGAGTRIANAVKGLNVIYRTEEVELQAIELGLVDKFTKILGITK